MLYICIYVSMGLFICFIYMYAFMYVWVYICVYGYIYVYAYIYISVYIRMRLISLTIYSPHTHPIDSSWSCAGHQRADRRAAQSQEKLQFGCPGSDHSRELPGKKEMDIGVKFCIVLSISPQQLETL